MNTQDYISSGILEQYVLGDLSEAEALEVADVAARFPAVRQEIALIEDTLQGIAEHLAIEPPPHLLPRIQGMLTTAPPPPAAADAEKPIVKKLHRWQYGVAATFTLKVLVMVVAAVFWSNWQSTQGRLDRLQERYDRLEQQAQQTTQALLAITDPAFQVVVLRSDTEAALPAYWNAQTRQLYVNLSQLPPPAPGQPYQLWGVAQDDTVSLGEIKKSVDNVLPPIQLFQAPAGLSALLLDAAPERPSALAPTNPRYQATF